MLMHEYFRKESDFSWDTNATEVPALVSVLRSITPPAES